MKTITTNYEPVKLTVTKTGKCKGCNKAVKQTSTFEQTINPWNKTKDGFIKTEDQIFKELKVEANKWVKDLKNKRYGDAALNPLNIFSKDAAKNSILIRLDDKLNRIKNSTELRKNDVSDIMGYLVLLCTDQGWTNFDDLLD